MKTKKILTVIMAALMAITAAFALSSCGKKPIDIDDLEDLLEDKDFTVSTYDSEESDVGVEYLSAYDGDISIRFAVYDKDDDGYKDLMKEFNEDAKDTIKDARESDDIKILKKTVGGSYACIEAVNEEYEEYAIIIRVDNTVIRCTGEDKHMDDARELLKEIGYR